jgi:serine phosphatase RsbU (regulator of sigma subunit)
LLVSRGIVEAERDDQEFGLEGAKKSFQEASALTAQELCLEILQSAEAFMETPPAHNDVTALALLRYRATTGETARAKTVRYGRTGKRK